MKYNFDEVIDRRGTATIAYDGQRKVYDYENLEPFWIADMDIKTPDFIINHLKNKLNQAHFGYLVWKQEAYLNAIKNWYKTRFSVNIQKNDIYYVPSILFTVTEVIREFTKEGEGVLIHTPSYNAFLNLIEGNKRVAVDSPLVATDNGYELDKEQFEEMAARDDVKVLVLCSPHNPTGKVWTKEECAFMKDVCERHGVFIVSDEIHMDFVRSENGFYSMTNEMTLDSPILVVTGLGKTFNLASLASSYMITKHRYFTLQFNRKLATYYGLSAANTLAVEAVKVAYNEAGEWVDQLNEHIEKNMTILDKFIKNEMSNQLSFIKPESTYLAWIDFSKSGYVESDVQKALQSVGKLATGIGHSYELGESHHFRMNLACSEEKLRSGLESIKKSFDALDHGEVE
ncbi:aminotransferase class I/II-fold pyridoxal phosphate-dependent enzyme [Mammaliicoccus sciuri]|uniref:MalY/PatB family protein n=1 Tax=Mammaliicoccus sciuri TaxID=1296 RepID=UPI0018DCD6B5|nr:aminotransferase class I/II-fold pyridoxal phosphate-dependent enzyme [Mammaliicoccus sciuri]MCJ1779599.1 aminotransferase class I/II-fold pyridoxal phosphate-dependent enzyme [Mammaliicoccus sciuri]QPW14826.1 aminotransferase class I/II-fold pyridoxal phosphate-dependent enzyme [Mammaliicoccus sciuri]